MNTYDIIFAIAVRLLAGVILHAHTSEGVVTVGRGKLIDWRSVKSGEEVEPSDGSAADFAQLFVALVGVEAADVALGGERAAPPGFVPPKPVITTYAPMASGMRRSQVELGGCVVLVTPEGEFGTEQEGTDAARRLAERIGMLEGTDG
jgi:hypothetical protein